MSLSISSADIDAAGGHRPAYEIRTYRMPAKVFHWLTAVLILGMVTSGILAKQFEGEPIADVLLSVHKLIGIVTFTTVLLRLVYRVLAGVPKPASLRHRLPTTHCLLYGVMIAVPLLGWAGVSDAGDRTIALGLSLPAIWPEGAGYDELLLHTHAYVAFGLLALVALHIGVAVAGHVTDAPPRPRSDPDGTSR